MSNEDALKELEEITQRLNMLVKAKVLGGFALIPFGVGVIKKIKKGKTYWIIDRELEQLTTGINVIEIGNPNKRN